MQGSTHSIPNRGASSSWDRLLAALDAIGATYKVSRTGHADIMCEPHGDTNPSLHADYDSRSGKTLLNCKAGCDVEDLLDWLNLTAAELFDDWVSPDEYRQQQDEKRRTEKGEKGSTSSLSRRRAQRRQARASSSGDGGGRPPAHRGPMPKSVSVVLDDPGATPVETDHHDYTDRAGTLVERVVRKESAGRKIDAEGEWHPHIEKTFRQRYPNPSGGWLHKEPRGFEPVLYRLPELVAAVDQGEEVFWLEGEKDADRAAALQVCSTTNVRGAKAKLPAAMLEVLRGAHVRPVLDLDGPGLRRASEISASLFGVAASLTFRAPLGPLGSDFSDHVDAGHAVDDLITLADATYLGRVANALDAAAKAQKAVLEVHARLQLAESSTTSREREANAQAAARWVRLADDQLPVVAMVATDPDTMADEVRGRWVREALEATRSRVRLVHELTATEVHPYFTEFLVDTHDVGGVEGDDTEDAEVVPLGNPSHKIESAPRGRWAYSLGDDGFARGIYQNRDHVWVRVTELPHVLAVIQHRDVSGRPTTRDFLLSRTSDGQGVIVDARGLSDGSWANALGHSLAAFPIVIQAAATVIDELADHAPVREETPRINHDTHRVDVPLADTLPEGYMALAPVDRESGIDTWREILDLSSASPVMSLALGAAAASPWLEGLSLDAQAWIFGLYGDRGLGKTSLLSTCGAIYGLPRKNSGVVVGLNSTANGVPALLGQLGILPAFLDEFGQLKLRPDERASFLNNIAEGASRLVSTRQNVGSRRSRPWCSVAFMTGNEDFLGDLSGGDVGLERRVIQFPAPITINREHSKALKALAHQAYGHLGQELLNRYSVDDVRAHLATAGQRLAPASAGSGKHHEDIAELLQLCLAGALMLDEVTGSTKTFYAALEAAVDYLDQLAEPEHDADRLVAAVLELIVTSPALWPTTSRYAEICGERGYEFAGLLHETKGDELIGVFPSTFTTICDRLKLNKLVALRELHKRGWLHVSGQVRTTSQGFQQTQYVAPGKRAKTYQLTLPRDVLDGLSAAPQEPTPQGPQHPAEPTVQSSDENGLFTTSASEVTSPVTSDVTSEVTSASPALTCGVTRVTSFLEDQARTPVREGVGAHTHAGQSQHVRPTPEPCVDCGEPTTGRTEDGRPLHLVDCSADAPTSPKPTPSNGSERSTAGGTGSTTFPTRDLHDQRPVAVADLDGLHLGAGEVVAYPNGELPSSVWQLVDLAFAHGVGYRSRISKDGPQVFITDALAHQVGAVVDLPANPVKADKLLAEHSAELTWIAPTRGWSLSEGQHLQAWCFGRHEDGRTARVVHLTYCTGQQAVPGYSEDISADDLADRHSLLARLLDLPFRISEATTGHDTMRLGRPRAGTRRDNGVTAPTLTTPLTFPTPFRDASHQLLFDGPFTRRPRPGEGKFLHMWDTNGAYPRATSRLYLGDDHDPEQFTSLSSADLDPKRPGIVLARRPDDWSHPYLASPWAPTGLVEDELEEAWMPTTTALWLHELGYTLDLADAWLWQHSAAYLDPWAIRHREGRKQLISMSEHDPNAAAILPAFKGIFRAGIGKLSDTRLLDRSEAKAAWFRPDHHSLIRGNARALMQRFIVKTATAYPDQTPVIVLTDAVGYLSDNPDPAEAWPGDPAKLSTQLGGFKHEASAVVDDELIHRLGRVPHSDAVNKVKELLTPANEWRF